MKTLKDFFTKERLILIVNIFFVLSILLDLHIFYNSISTLIRIGIIGLLFLIIFLFYSNKKERKYLYIYFVILIFYIIFHLIHCNIINISNINYSIVSEILYFIKMITNVLTIYVIYKLDYKTDNFKKTVQISTALIAGSIIICNIFKIGYTSYDFTQLKYNIFDWYSGSYSFAELSNKGFFHLTNQISALLSLYFSVILIYLKEKVDWKSIVPLLLSGIAMMMLGTRISSYMPMILIIMALFVYLLLVVIKREKFCYKFVIVLLLLFGINTIIYQNSPVRIRNEYYKILFAKPKKPKKSDIELMATPVSELSNTSFRKLLTLYNIDDDFYNSYYKLENDRPFYEYYVSLETTQKNNTRFLEKEVIKRIVYLNNNENDKFIGIGYDRVMNVFNIESDYTMQYYAIGIIGTIILLGVNVLLLMYCYFKVLFNLHRYFSYKNITLLMSVTMFLATAYLSGNLLNSISCIIPISMVIGIMLNELKREDEKVNYESMLGLKTCTYNENKIIKDVFNSTEQNIIFNINPLIAMNNRKNVNNIKVINNYNYNIPDGNGIVLASKLKTGYINKSIPGIDLMELICKKSVSKKYSIFLYGATEDSVEKTKNNLVSKYKNINIVGYINGYTDNKEVLLAIKKSKPDILFVALGSPKQENFIINNFNDLKNIKIIMPVGGSFDVISGNLLRAPKWIQKLKIEWLYRMIKEPKRFKYLGSIIKFMFLAIFSDICYNKEEVND